LDISEKIIKLVPCCINISFSFSIIGLVDGVDWSSYNDRLVREVDVIFDVGLVGSFFAKRLGRLGRGRPQVYGDAAISALAVLRAYFNLPYRQTEGLARRFACLLGLERVPDYTTIFRREKGLKVPTSLRPGGPGEGVVIAIDATGWKVTNRGEWKRQGRKGWVKLHIAVNVKTKEILSVRLTDERVHDREAAEPLVKEARQRIHPVKLLADGAYDSKELFNLLQELDIEPVIRVRKDSSRLARGCPARRRAVLAQQQPGWQKRLGYGMRWLVETAFSTLKRRFGEFLRATKQIYAFQEMLIKCFVYNLLIRYR